MSAPILGSLRADKNTQITQRTRTNCFHALRGNSTPVGSSASRDSLDWRSVPSGSGYRLLTQVFRSFL